VADEHVDGAVVRAGLGVQARQHRERGLVGLVERGHVEQALDRARRVVEPGLVDLGGREVELDPLGRRLRHHDVAAVQVGERLPLLLALEHALESAVRVVRVRVGREQRLVRADRAPRIAVLELGGELAQRRQLLALGGDLREALHRAEVVVGAAGLVVEIDERLERGHVGAVGGDGGLVARDRALEIPELLGAHGAELAAERGGAALVPARLGHLGAAVEHLGEVRPLLVAAVQPLEGGERIVGGVVEIRGLLVGLDRLVRLRELALVEVTEAEQQVDLGRGRDLDLGVRAERLGEVRPALLLAVRVGHAAVGGAVRGVELERAAQRGQRVVDAVEPHRVPAAEARPPGGRDLGILHVGRDLRALGHEIGPAAGGGRELLGERDARVAGRVDLAGGGHGLERARQIADARLVDLGELPQQLRAIRPVAGVLDAAEQHLDHVLPLALGARLALDQIERVAGLGGLVAGVTEQGGPALDVVGVRPGLRQRHAGGGAALAQRLEPVDHRALGDLVAALAREVHDLDVVIGHQLVDRHRAHAGAEEVVRALRRLEHAEHAVEERGQVGIAVAEPDEHERALDVHLAGVVAEVDGARQGAADRVRRDDVGVEVAEHLDEGAAARRQLAELLVRDHAAGRPLRGRLALERVLEHLTGERGPHVAERQLREDLGERRHLEGRGPHLLDDLVAGLLAERAGQEPDGARQAALVEELLEVLGGHVVAVATTRLERLGHALQQLLPGRDSDTRTDDQGCFARLDLLDESLGDRVLRHPKTPVSLLSWRAP